MALREKVPCGLFWGFTLEELNESLAAYKAAVKDQVGKGQIVGVAQNGKSAQYQVGGKTIGLQEWGLLLRDAFAWVSDEIPEFLPSRTSVAVFR